MSILPRNRPFHGWIIVFALSIAGGFSMSMAIGNVGLFVDPMGEELGIGRSAFGWAHTARLVGFAVSGPVIGLLLDRYGARVMLATAAVLFGLATATLGLASSAWQIIGLFLFMGLLGFWGSSTLYFTVPVAKWFIRQRGKAMSIVFVGVPIGVGISAPVAQLLIDAMGWRGALMVLGLTGSVVIATLSLTAVRNRPEDMGLRPDGDAALVAGQTAGGEGEDRKERSWTTKDAIRTGAFWRLAIAFGTMMLSMSAMTLFWVPYYSSIGFPVHLAALGFSMQGFTQVLASILLSKLMDHVQPRYLALAGFISFILAFLVTLNSTEHWHVLAAGFLAGMGIGSVMLTQAQIWPVYFGRERLGTIRGLATPITLGFSAIGGAASGIIFDTTGTYVYAWWMAIGALALGGLLLGISPKPRHSGDAVDEEPARG